MPDETVTEFKPSKEDLLQLREWLKKMPHLLQDYDDQFLTAFVTGCKGSLQKTKDRLEHFNALGIKFPQLFGTYDPLYPILQENLKSRLICPLPKKTSDGCTVFLACNNPNLNGQSKIYVTEFIRYLLLSLLVLIWENEFGEGKWMYISLSKNLSIADINDLTPMMIKQATKSLQHAFPIRFQSCHLFNVSNVAEYAFKIIKTVASKKISERLFLHNQLDGINDVLPVDMLPKEYGGQGESIVLLHENWKKKVESYRERFLEEEKKMRALDHLRPKTDEEDEMIGTFKQLSVD